MAYERVVIDRQIKAKSAWVPVDDNQPVAEPGPQQLHSLFESVAEAGATLRFQHDAGFPPRAAGRPARGDQACLFSEGIGRLASVLLGESSGGEFHRHWDQENSRRPELMAGFVPASRWYDIGLSNSKCGRCSTLGPQSLKQTRNRKDHVEENTSRHIRSRNSHEPLVGL